MLRTGGALPGAGHHDGLSYPADAQALSDRYNQTAGNRDLVVAQQYQQLLQQELQNQQKAAMMEQAHQQRLQAANNLQNYGLHQRIALSSNGPVANQ